MRGAPRIMQPLSSYWMSYYHDRPSKIIMISLDLVGLLLLADVSAVSERTALTGNAFLADALVLCPGMHRQQYEAADLTGGEFPATAAMTTGYVFRVENSGTVFFLQRVSRTGQLTTLKVTRDADRLSSSSSSSFLLRSTIATAAYLGAMLLTVSIITLSILTQDWWGFLVICILVVARLLNALLIRRRSKPGWHGASEPGQKGDLIILLSHDRWVRMRGAVDDLKAVTSGRWLRDLTGLETAVAHLANLLVYFGAVLAANMTLFSQALFVLLVIGSVGLVHLANVTIKVLHMHGNTIALDGARKSYRRRLDLAHELIQETGRHDWALKLGMVKKDNIPETSQEQKKEGYQNSASDASSEAVVM